MKVDSKKLENGDLEITLTFDMHDQVCLEHDLVSIVDWYASGPAAEKIHSCRKRMLQNHKELLMKDPEMLAKPFSEVNAILADPVACVDMICKHPEYKNRAQREEKEKTLLN